MKKFTITWAHITIIVVILAFIPAILLSSKTAKIAKLVSPYRSYATTIKESTNVETLSNSLYQAKAFLEAYNFEDWTDSLNESIEGLRYLKKVKASGSDRLFSEMEAYKNLLNSRDFVNQEEIGVRLYEHLGAPSMGALFFAWLIAIVLALIGIVGIFEWELMYCEVISFTKKATI